MTTQSALPLMGRLGALLVGEWVALLEEPDGAGRIFINGQLAYVWGPEQREMRRLAAAQLVETGAAQVNEVAAAFNINTESLRRWRISFDAEGLAGLASVKKGPKRPSLLTEPKADQIRAYRATGASLRATAIATGVSTDTVRRAMAMTVAPDTAPTDNEAPAVLPAVLVQEELPVLPAPVPRSGERAAAGEAEAASPVFFPAARVPYVGLFLAFPALESSGLLTCAKSVYGALPNGFYGLETILVDAVVRALAGESRAEGATRFNPEDLGRILGLDRAPEVKTIRRRIAQLAQTGKAPELIAALASHHLTNTGQDGAELAAILYVDGHVRAYQGTKKIGKLYSTRLKFPVPATEETWVSDTNGSPVFLVMAEPGASLAGELRRLLPELRTAIGDDRRVLVGFDRGGWSPTLFAHMKEQGFDVLTWYKGKTADINETLFTQVSYTDEHGETRSWSAADTLMDLPLTTTAKTGEVFQIRAISQIVPNTKGSGTRQIHILTTDHDLPAGEAIHRMGNRWRQENQFRYARMHFELDSHDCYTSSDDDPQRMVPNPAKTKAYQLVVAARKHHAGVAAQVDAGELDMKNPAPGTQELMVTNTMINTLKAPLWAAETALNTAEAAHKELPARVRLGDLAPGQQVLDTETKLIHHGIRIAAYNTAMTIAREIRTNTGYKRGSDEAHALMRQAFNQPGDIDPTIPGQLTITLDPMPTKAKTLAIAELCEHLTNTKTNYPGTNFILHYKIKKNR
ncbi:putative transposase [Arthrobacter sp.]|uniref:putative transposase n=1 Tax=Arthrobacter sp. TaxID=1667 RepID=UPI0026E0AA6B|nr:helix-turn-helix domain-containing protein [Arthrobacter sp.]MDO5754548.1 helix-turn-helix domain-containing protein [Arthrobacter sp.]